MLQKHHVPAGFYFQISFTYRLAWENGTFRCPPNFNQTECWALYLNNKNVTVTNSGLNRWQSYTWKCTSGCKSARIVSDLHNLQYTDIAEFLNDSWETGVEIFNATFQDDEQITELKVGFVIYLSRNMRKRAF